MVQQQLEPDYDKRWEERLRIVKEAYADYLTGMAALRKRVVSDMKRKMSDKKVLDRPHLEPSAPREEPASAARHRLVGGRRPRG